MPAPRIRRAVRIGCALAGTLGIWLLGGWIAVAVATAPRPTAIAPIATLAGRPVADVTATSADGHDLHAWLVDASSRGIVIAFAGYGGNRTSNLGLAQHYVERGWSVLLPDLRATGTSQGNRIGLGYLERLDVAAWIAFARSRAFADVALHGQSLGAAAIAYSAASVDECAFVVLDGCYDDVLNALDHRLPWVPFPRLTLKPIEWFGRAALGAAPRDLRPVDHVASLRAPTLVVAGDRDPFVLPTETQRLFAACGAAAKLLHWIPGGGHEDLWARSPAAYVSAVDEILALAATHPRSTRRR